MVITYFESQEVVMSNINNSKLSEEEILEFDL